MAIIVLQHSDHAGPGRLGATLRDHGFRLEVRWPDPSSNATPSGLPTDLDGVHGLVILGGPQNVTDLAKYRWMQAEVELVKRAHARELPVVGICLGSQVIAHALGGEVAAMAKPEVGFERVSLNAAGQTEPIMAGIAWNSPQFLSHGQEVAKLPAGATLLSSSKGCKVQAFRAGVRTFGFQYHFECDQPLVESIVAHSKPEMEKGGITPGEIKAQMDQYYAAFARLGDRLCVNIATLAFPLSRRLTA